MNRAIVGVAFAVALLGSGSAFAAGAAAPATPAPAAAAAPMDSTTPPTPPATLKCKAPKVPTQVTSKSGKVTWKCVKPAATPATTPAPH